MRVFRRFLLSLLGCLVVYLGVVGTIDPRAEFWGRWFEPVVVNIRTIKREQYRHQLERGPITGVVLGSSRMMNLDPTTLTTASGGRYFNFAVFAATIEDLVVLGRTAQRLNPGLRTLVVGLDETMLAPGELNTEFDRTWWLRRELRPDQAGPLYLALQIGRAVARALTLSYFQNAVLSVRVTMSPRAPNYRYREDGFLEYAKRDADIAAGVFDVDQAIRGCVPASVKKFAVSYVTDPDRAALLREFLRSMKQLGVEVLLLRPPLSPPIHAALEKDASLLANHDRAVGSIVEIAQETGTTWRDFGRVETFGGSTTAWYDCVHPQSETGRALIRALFPAPAER